MPDNSNAFLERMVSAAFLGLFIGSPPAIRIGRAMSSSPCRMTSKGYPAPRKVFLDAFHVAGMRHYDARRVIDVIRPGDQLRLRAEPDNPHGAFGSPRRNQLHFTTLGRLVMTQRLFRILERQPAMPCQTARARKSPLLSAIVHARQL